MAPAKKGDLAAEETELLQAVSKGNVQEACRLLGLKTVRINCLDEHGMTPLMHAAYKGRAELCELLLRHGANVNCNEHEHGYTALMFAGLSGNKEITRMMLEAGAKTDAVNSVGRTAAQMAAFVGQHDCVTIINNFFSRESLDYYTRPQGLETEARLPAQLAAPLHRIILTTNLNPVKVLLMVGEGPLCSVEALAACARVLERVCERCMQQQDMNEVLAVKIHYLGAIFSRCLAHLRDGVRGGGGLDGLLKSLLKGREEDGFPLHQEKFVREAVRKFPFPQATLLQQLVRSIAPVEIGREPTALSILTQAVTGQVGLVDAEFCTTCGEKGADKKCSACKMVVYCGQPCQKLHWFTHKKSCRHLAEEWRRQEARAARERDKFGKEQQEEQQQQLESPAAGASKGNGEGGEEASASVPEDPTQAAPQTPTDPALREDPKGADSTVGEGGVTTHSVEE